MENPQFAYTGAPPAKGYVGYVKIQEVEGGIRFLVRSEGEQPVTASYVVPTAEASGLLAQALVFLGDPPHHDFWSAGDPGCPADVKAGNGELHTLRCKRCGQDSPRSHVCAG